MGANMPNLTVKSDYATPNNYSALEFHMELPVSLDEQRQLHDWFQENNWDAVADMISAKYPHHRELIQQWVSDSKVRSDGEQSPRLSVVNA